MTAVLQRRGEGRLPSTIDNRPIRTLLPMACDGVGPSMTCLNLMNGAWNAGYKSDLYVNRLRMPPPDVPTVSTLPGLLRYLPHSRLRSMVSRQTEERFMASLRPGDIAYLWPAASLQIHRHLKERGIPIILEGINTRMKSAKAILDEAYEAFGTPPAHTITQERIEEEEEKYTYAQAIFAPNKHVESALLDSPLKDALLPTSYGVDVTKASPPRDYAQPRQGVGAGLVFLFCGYACIRKGIHFLLDAWQKVEGPHTLRLVGNIEPIVADRYRSQLSDERIDIIGFVDDVHKQFAQADIFVMPSLEEGGPQVTYEAALHGLPTIASPMGASRLGDTVGSMLIVDPWNTEELAEKMNILATSDEARNALGSTARSLAFDFHWPDVGARRAAQLDALFPKGAI